VSGIHGFMLRRVTPACQPREHDKTQKTGAGQSPAPVRPTSNRTNGVPSVASERQLGRTARRNRNVLGYMRIPSTAQTEITPAQQRGVPFYIFG